MHQPDLLNGLEVKTRLKKNNSEIERNLGKGKHSSVLVRCVNFGRQRLLGGTDSDLLQGWNLLHDGRNEIALVLPLK